jgi:hypothetical protein
LPPYSLTYDPNSVSQLNSAFTKAGLSGAGGTYYGGQYPVGP